MCLYVLFLLDVVLVGSALLQFLSFTVVFISCRNFVLMRRGRFSSASPPLFSSSFPRSNLLYVKGDLDFLAWLASHTSFFSFSSSWPGTLVCCCLFISLPFSLLGDMSPLSSSTTSCVSSFLSFLLLLFSRQSSYLSSDSLNLPSSSLEIS